MNRSELLTQECCHDVFEQALRAARARGVPDFEVTLRAHAAALTRFANNVIHQNVAESMVELEVRPVIGQRTARAATNRLDRGSIESLVEQAIALARAMEPDPALPPLAEHAPIAAVNRYFDSTARCSPAGRAACVAEAIGAVREAGHTAAGIYSTGESVEALLNSNGAFAFHGQTMAVFSITALGETSSGWAKGSAPDRNALDPVGLARRAAVKATKSARPREVPPGRYAVVLEPSAVLDLTGSLFADFSATSIEDRRSFLTGRMGAQLFGANITIVDDVFHPLQDGAPFDGEGAPRMPLTLVDGGAPKEIAYSRRAALRARVAPTGHGFPLPNEAGEAPQNVVFQGGDATLDGMIASTPRGILVSRLWYIREVDPYEKIMTGMTRDGTFLVENGEIVAGLRNFRFNQGLIDLLRNVESMSPSVRASGEESADMVVPAMKAGDFHFTELTRF
ncbi:MAG: TldD/PmbA family protein [Bryobacteraceae bacterium]|nr:TldD/PmbA family protein [Bryobacteraceae bacterium]